MKYIITTIYTLLILMSCSSDSSNDENGQSNTPDPIYPSDLTLDITIIGESSDFPNGDGSGEIICFATATDAINYEFRFGAGNVIESQNGQVQFSFSEPGLQSRTIYVYAYSVTGHYISTSISFDLYVDDQDQSAATWSEEFNYTGSINGNIWTAEIGNGNNGWGNGESQFYTADPENVRVEDGVLKITAKRENLAGYNFTSSRIISKDKYEFKYGRELILRLNYQLGSVLGQHCGCLALISVKWDGLNVVKLILWSIGGMIQQLLLDQSTRL